jgi:hypothetical protein
MQYAYGYYLDKCYYDEVMDLFDSDSEVIFIGRAYKGRANGCSRTRLQSRRWCALSGMAAVMRRGEWRMAVHLR